MADSGGLQNFPQLAASPLFPLLLASLKIQKNSPVSKYEFKNEYDYIIVGAGSAGSAVAGRLSEESCVSVLLLEAGGTPPIITEIPGIDSNFYPEDIFWTFATTAHKHAGSALLNGSSTYIQGRCLGGSSAVNGMAVTRGNLHNYQDWVSLGADESWDPHALLYYFKKMETESDEQYIANGYHGTHGPVTTSRPNYNPDVKKAILKTILEMGYEYGDTNAHREYGFSDFQGTIRKGQRCSAAKAYLVPCEGRPNLDIVTNALVTKILFEGKRAADVQFEFNGTKHKVKARKEIILSAGAINTPRLLLLSGVGPEKELKKLQIPIVADLPVGKNFHDHVASYLFYQWSDSLPLYKDRYSSDRAIANYIIKREGPLGSIVGTHAMAFLSTNDTGKIDDRPNYELFFYETPTDYIKSLGFDPKVYEHVFGPYEDRALFACTAVALNPKSRGTIRLRSADPKDLPIVDPNFLADPQDFEDLVEGMKTCHKILSSPTMSKAGAKIIPNIYPGCESFSRNLDESSRCLVRSFISPFLDLAGTARMGRLSDTTTVVDSKLRVKSLQGLRVADASIMPKVIWGHTNVPSIMIGEKASDMIKEDIQC